MKKIFGKIKIIFQLVWLRNLNFFLIQWFFIRIGRVGEIVNGEFVQTGWTIVRYPLPLTGWWNDYVWLYKPKKEKTNS